MGDFPNQSPGAFGPAQWISIRHLQRAVVYLGAREVDAEACLREAGIDPACLQDGDGKIGLAAMERLLSIVGARIDTPCLGIDMARSISPASFGVLGHLFQACDTLGDLLAMLVNFNGLMSSFGHSSLERGPGVATLSWTCRAGGRAFRECSAEFLLASATAIARTLAPTLPGPVVVRFQHAATSAEAHALRVEHFGCPVHMQQLDNAIVIPAALLNARLPHGDAELKRLLEQRAQALLASRRAPASLLDEVKRQVRQSLALGTPARQEVARRLSLSESSFHRRLQEAGTTFQALVDDVRLQLATHTLAQGSITASITASRLGFSSPQVFARWFRQQTGLTPAQYREQASQRPSPDDKVS